MASTRSNTPFSIDEFASLVESALDLDHEPDISIHLPQRAPSRVSYSPSRRLTSTSSVFSKFKQLVSPPRPRLERFESRTTPIPTVSLMAPGSTEFVPFLPLASRRELEARAAVNNKTSSIISVDRSSYQSSPTTPCFPPTPTYAVSICSSAEIASTASELEDPFAKGSVQIISVTPNKSKSRCRTRPPPLNIYAPPSCPLPSPPSTPSPTRTNSSSSSSYQRHPYASADWTLDLPVSRFNTCPPYNPLSPRRRGNHKRTGSPFPLSLTLHDDTKLKTRLTPACHVVLPEAVVPPPVSASETNWVDMKECDEEDSDESLEGMQTPVPHLARRCHSDSELRTPVQYTFPLSPAQSLDDDDAQSAYFSARSSLCSESQFCFRFSVALLRFLNMLYPIFRILIAVENCLY
ncbi:hypothetical protein CPB85DRAFT_1250689 [Mucidula mucida]|nr:hypothetical protein CPB85DRAFT_1250689 [Mucidula mucida]